MPSDTPGAVHLWPSIGVLRRVAQIIPRKAQGAQKVAAPAARAVDLKDVDILMSVAEIGSLRGTASALNLQPSTVSRRIRSLENRLGASLFERSRSGVRMTEAGRSFHDEAQIAIQHLDQAVRSVVLAGHAGNGRVAIGIIGSLSSCFLEQLIRRFRVEHPAVVLTVSEGSNHDHLAGIEDRSLDLAFVLKTCARRL